MTRTTAMTLGLAAVAAAAIAVAVARVRRRRRGAAAEPPPARREWRCACGQEYLVAGTDRHRIYWVAGATPDDPLLDTDCVRCGAQLPVEHEGATVEQ
jgi:hypothetical protein